MTAPTGEPLDVPVVLLTFNRPDKTAEVFAQIARQRPQKLFVVSDGPREDHPSDVQHVRESRRIVEDIDWSCDVTQLFSPVNLGCRERILSGLNEVFDQVPCAIILEDDCLPHDDFFAFSAHLLERFTDEPRIFSIGGHIWEFPDEHVSDGYLLSKYFSSWGWATWSGKWKLVDADLSGWPERRGTPFLHEWSDSPMEIAYWHKVLDMVHDKEPPLAEAWDYAVQFSMWMHNMLAVRPRVNLVQNLGFDGEATHTPSDSPAVSGRLARGFPWPIVHPESLVRNRELDAVVNQTRVGGALRARLRGGA